MHILRIKEESLYIFFPAQSRCLVIGDSNCIGCASFSFDEIRFLFVKKRNKNLIFLCVMPLFWKNIDDFLI